MLEFSPFLIPIIAVATPALVIIIVVLTQHQRKMAEIMHRGSEQQNQPQIEALTHEIRELRQSLTQQTIALDTLASELRQRTLSVVEEEPLSQRLSQPPHS